MVRLFLNRQLFRNCRFDGDLARPIPRTAILFTVTAKSLGSWGDTEQLLPRAKTMLAHTVVECLRESCAQSCAHKGASREDN